MPIMNALDREHAISRFLWRAAISRRPHDINRMLPENVSRLARQQAAS